MIIESHLDISKHWYLGNNSGEDLKISRPAWNAPFFLTTSKEYAKDYADYGVWEVSLKNEVNSSKILDFSKPSDVSKLNWPKKLIDKINEGASDLNAIAYDLWLLLNDPDKELLQIENTEKWLDVAMFIDAECDKALPSTAFRSHWQDDVDYKYLLRLWADIYEAGFDGFTHIEFGNRVLALFNIKFIDKISVSRIDEVALIEDKKTYLKKYANEEDVKKIVDKFWDIRHRVKAPENDIDWWIKKPFGDLKRFVLDFDFRNKDQRKSDERKQALEDSGATKLGSKDGYEIWYVPTYEAAIELSRYYKGRSSHWCISSDDPCFWFDTHDQSEFIFLIREKFENDENDKVAVEFEDGGRYFNVDHIRTWNINNDDEETFFNNDLLKYAWALMKDSGLHRERYNENIITEALHFRSDIPFAYHGCQTKDGINLTAPTPDYPLFLASSPKYAMWHSNKAFSWYRIFKKSTYESRYVYIIELNSQLKILDFRNSGGEAHKILKDILTECEEVLEYLKFDLNNVHLQSFASRFAGLVHMCYQHNYYDFLYAANHINEKTKNDYAKFDNFIHNNWQNMMANKDILAHKTYDSQCESMLRFFLNEFSKRGYTAYIDFERATDLRHNSIRPGKHFRQNKNNRIRSRSSEITTVNGQEFYEVQPDLGTHTVSSDIICVFDISAVKGGYKIPIKTEWLEQYLLTSKPKSEKEFDELIKKYKETYQKIH